MGLIHVFNITFPSTMRQPYFIDSLIFSPDNTELIAFEYSYIRHRWSLDTGKLIETTYPTFLGCDGPCYRNYVFSSPDASQLAYLGPYGGIMIGAADLSSFKRALRTGGCDSCGGYSLAFSPDGTKLAAGLDQGFMLFDVKSGEWLIDDDDFIVLRMAFSPNSSRVVAISDYGILSIYDVKTGTIVVQSENYWGQGNIARFSYDGKLLATGYRTGITNIWNLESGQLQTRLQANLSITGLIFSADNQFIQYTGMHRRFLEYGDIFSPFLQIETGEPGNITLPTCADCYATYFNPLGGGYYLLSSPHESRYIASGSSTPLWVSDTNFDHVVFTASGNYFISDSYNSDTNQRVLTLRESITGKSLRSFPLHIEVAQLASTRDESKVIIRDQKGWFYLCAFEVQNCEITLPLEDVYQFAQSTDYQLLALLRENGDILILESHSLELIATLHPAQTAISSIALSNRGDLYSLAVVTYNGLTQVWTFELKTP
jgi:WD40 repeat protein